MIWRTATASARGSAHQRLGLPNQDAVEYALGSNGNEECAIVAISDGHGGSRHFRSQVGSTLAVHAAITLLKDFLNSSGDFVEGTDRENRIEALNRQMVEAWLGAVQSDLEHNPITTEELEKLKSKEDGLSGESIEENPTLAYGCTLLATMASQTFVLFLQLGDGDILTVDSQGRTARPLPHDERLVANQTTSMCQPEAWREVRYAVLERHENLPSLVLLSTDGYMNSFRTEEDFLQIGKDYLAIIREQGIDALSQELPKILAEASQHGSGDDITLAILQGDVNRGAMSEAARSVAATASPDPPKTPHVVPAHSKSVLYEQLRAKHSAQQRELAKLSSDVAETKKNMQRLRLISSLLALVAIAIPAYYYWPHATSIAHKGPVDVGAIPDIKIGDAPPSTGTPPGGPGKAAIEERWVLTYGDQQVPLDKNAKLVLVDNKFFPAAEVKPKQPPYVEVQEGKGILRIVNHSKDKWHASLTSDPKQSQEIKKGEAVDLVDGMTIKFKDGVEGKVRMAGPMSKAEGDAE